MNTSAIANLSTPTGVYGNRLSSFQSGSDTVDSSVRSIEKKLDEDGWFDDVTYQDLLDINNILKQLSPQQTNEVISRLSHESLQKWADEINSNGIFGTGGLSTDERKDLFKNLASDLSTYQFARIYDVFNDPDIKTELLTAANENMNQEMITTAIKDQLGAPSVTEAGRTQLQKTVTSLNSIQNASNMASLSADVYLDFGASSQAYLPGNMIRLNPDNIPASLGITKDDLIDTDSGFHAAVYQVNQGGETKYVVAFRGTESFFGPDGITNVVSNFMVSKQFEMANRLLAKIIGEQGSDKVSVTGHSLGGSLANYAALNHNISSITFNAKGTTLPERIETGDWFGEKAQHLITNYQVKGELLTNIQEEIHLLLEAPGNTIKIPAIKADGTPGNMLTEILVEITLYSIPFIGPGMADKHDISGPLDRHGIGYVERGMNKIKESATNAVLDSLFKSYEPQVRREASMEKMLGTMEEASRKAMELQKLTAQHNALISLLKQRPNI